MAIVKATFTHSVSAAKANVRYISHRPNKEGEKSTRELWTEDGKVTKQEAYDLIEHTDPSTFFYRFAFSPDPKMEDAAHDLQLRGATADMMRSLNTRFGTPIPWIATAHENHSPHRHVHILAL